MSKNYYDILEISPTSSQTPADLALVKSAYRKALLKHHPDKVSAGKTTLQETSNQRGKNDIPTIDEITQAYQTLSDVKARSKYDRELLLRSEKEAIDHSKSNERKVGIEIIDLDDMDYDEQNAIWTRECRCGVSGGYVLSEDDLEKAANELGAGSVLEILVGCAGCSLSLKVNFAIMEET